LILRAGRDDDAAAVIALITSCWSEYPGVYMDVDGENPELRSLASYFSDADGAFWVAEDVGGLKGMVATRPSKGASWELCRMYVSADARGTGLANDLVRAAEDFARARGATRMHLWSDTRFDRAHRFYERCGYVRDGGIKPLLDASNTLDFGYAKPLAGVEVWALDIAAASSAARSLGRILKACVDDGASVSFMPPFTVADGEAFYRNKARDIAAGTRILLAGWVDGALAGTVTLDFDMPPNQPHRGDLQKLLVHPAHRRQGLARALMEAAENATRKANRQLLVLDTADRSGAEILYRTLGWIEVGSIPDFAHNPAGALEATTLFYKRIAL
jgi:GNAT superfamily N-acetyltransferase